MPAGLLLLLCLLLLLHAVFCARPTSNACAQHCRPAAACRERQHGWPADPLWVESNWPTGTPALQLYLQEAPGTEAALLVSGVLVAAASVALTLGVRAAYHRKLKQQ